MKSDLKRHGKRIRVFPMILLILILLIALLFIDSNFRIVTTEYELYYSNLPDSFDGFRIVVLADVHDTEFGRGNNRLISRIHDAKPDIIVISGDLLNAYGNSRPEEKQLERIETLIVSLVPIAPVYFVSGNHDANIVFGGSEALFEVLEEGGVRILRNDYDRIEFGGEAVIIAGVNYHGKKSLEKIESELADRIYDTEGDAFVILLRHRNDNMHFLSEHAFDLILSGHAHGGVIRLPFTDGLIGPTREWFPTHTSGVYTMDNTNMLVSRGLGNPSSVPRFLNNPHIAVAVLRSA